MKWSKKFLTLVLGVLVISVNYGHSSISDLKQNNISLPDGVDAGGAKPADIDGDGDLDFVIMDFTGVPPFGLPSQRIAWARNDGGSDWTVLPISGSEEGLESFEVADMDGDGDLDVITGAYGRRTSFNPFGFDIGTGAYLRVYTNNGQGSFTQNTILDSNDAKYIEGVTVADLDRDGDPDIIVLQRNRVVWFPNNGNRSYGNPKVIRQQNGLYPEGVDTGDVDGDGDIDVIVSTFPDSGGNVAQIICMKNPGRGNGLWQRTVVAESEFLGMGKMLFLEDINDDSILDIVGSSLPITLTNSFGYHLGDGNGNFGEIRAWSFTDGRVEGFHIVDLDGDGDLDWFVARPNVGSITYEVRQGGATLLEQTITLPRMSKPDKAQGTGLFTADINGDGRLDLITHGAEITWYELVVEGQRGLIIVDSDSDGITDDLERELGTNPNDATDRPIETGASIGINFLSDRDLAAQILSDELAGHPSVAQKNWNNTNGDASGSGSNLLGGNGSLTDSDSNASRAIVSWASNGTWNTSNGRNSGDNKLMNGYLDNVNSDGYSRVDLYNITYENYDVYVYLGSDGNGRTGTIESTTARQTFSYSTYSNQGGAFPGGYIITADQGNSNPSANVCVFRDQSSGSFSVQINRGNGNSGIYGIQIVPSDKGNDILDGVGATRADAISLGVLADPDTIIDFNTLQSSIDTEIGLYRPDGGLLAESDNVFGGFQSGLRFQNLYSGIWYLAVGENDTIFTDGFSVRGGPPGGIFMLSVNDTREINARIQETGVTWFSFEIRPNPLGLPPENPLPLGQLGDGTLPLSFNTFGSNTDTEIALYGPNGDLLIENDDFNGAPQSSITARNLVEGTYHIAVGRYDTRFKDGFSVERRPTGSDNFILNLGTSQGIREVIPEVGVKWFSFEVGPVIIPEVAFNSVRLREGNVIISWNTLKGQNYQVQRSNDMKRWVNVGGLEQGTGNVLDYSETASKKQEFFRVVIP